MRAELICNKPDCLDAANTTFDVGKQYLDKQAALSTTDTTLDEGEQHLNSKDTLDVSNTTLDGVSGVQMKLRS